jgi:hypothetical protein
VQNAKDTFYEVLRQRLAALNPERTIVLRGVVRPGLLVEENELLTTVTLPDCFRISWSEVVVDAQGDLPLVTMQCVVAYETAGSALNSGMDRGRALEQMNAELLSALTQAPMSTAKMNYSALANGGSAASMTTSIWWGTPVFGKMVVEEDRIARTATVQVMSFQEAGEL